MEYGEMQKAVAKYLVVELETDTTKAQRIVDKAKHPVGLEAEHIKTVIALDKTLQATYNEADVFEQARIVKAVKCVLEMSMQQGVRTLVGDLVKDAESQ